MTARPALGECPCSDPVKGGDTCYEPVCAAGYYKCCASCSASVCSNFDEMEISWRGVEECIPCAPGDYCAGCDTFSTCPVSERVGREGSRISPFKAQQLADCEACPIGTEANFDHAECVPKYSHQCDKKFVQRCMRFCEPEDPKRGKVLNACEEQKCMMYCARRWSEGCAKELSKQCKYKTEYVVEGMNPDWFEGISLISDCDVDCNSAGGQHVGILASLLAVAVAASASWQ